MVIDMIIENNDGNTPSVDDLAWWADQYKVKIPVVADEGEAVVAHYVSGSYGLPYKVLLDRGVVVKKIGDATDADVAELLGD